MRPTPDPHDPGPGSAPAVPVPAPDDPGRFRFGRRAILVDFAVWTVLAVLSVANRYALPSRPVRRGGEAFAQRPGLDGMDVFYWLLDGYLWALATPLIFWLAWRFSGERREWATRVLVLGGCGILVAVLMGLAGDLLATNLLGRRPFGPPRTTWIAFVLHPGLLFDFITYVGVLATGFAWEYFRRYRVREEEAVRLQAHAASLQAQLAEARLSALRNQLNPHFLFNTLNAVSALVAKDPKGVRRMISRLSDLLRYSLSELHPQEITVDEELKLTARYLEILEIRYQGRLETAIDAESGVGEALVPSLILQPLAENAMTHGVGQAGGYGRIEVVVRRRGAELVLSVRDSGPGEAGEVGEPTELAPGGAGGGVGLRNTRARLTELYGDAHRLELRPTAEGGMVAEIVLPFHVRAAARNDVAPWPAEEPFDVREATASGTDRR